VAVFALSNHKRLYAGMKRNTGEELKRGTGTETAMVLINGSAREVKRAERKRAKTALLLFTERRYFACVAFRTKLFAENVEKRRLPRCRR